MNKEQELINFTILYGGEAYPVSCRRGDYRNLMVFLRDQFFPDAFGECGGMGRCGTCMVALQQAEKANFQRQRNEGGTLAKMGVQDTNKRLSCQMLIDESLQDACIEISDSI